VSKDAFSYMGMPFCWGGRFKTGFLRLVLAVMELIL
jgi:hypothetical protein